jgi:hypothetical protein
MTLTWMKDLDGRLIEPRIDNGKRCRERGVRSVQLPVAKRVPHYGAASARYKHR